MRNRALGYGAIALAIVCVVLAVLLIKNITSDGSDKQSPVVTVAISPTSVPTYTEDPETLMMLACVSDFRDKYPDRDLFEGEYLNIAMGNSIPSCKILIRELKLKGAI